MELGGDFELDVSQLKKTENHIFNYLESYHTIYVNSGRNAIRLLRAALPKGKVLLPAYICESVIKEFRENGVVEFYKINPDFSIDLEDLKSKIDEQVSVFYLMHYFGALQTESILEYVLEQKRAYQFVVVEDTTHSIFTKRCTVGDYCVCSLRKWFPIMDGGVLYSAGDLSVVDAELRPVAPSEKLDAMILKKMYIKHQLECNSLYRAIFSKEESRMDEQPEIFSMSELSRAILKGISLAELRERRKRNYKELYSFLLRLKIRPILGEGDFVPLCCPIYVDRRDALRAYLIEHQIYCAVHWPLQGTELEYNQDAKCIAERILSFPIDQRYDMQYMKYLETVMERYGR